jgi:hypothetical protein
MTRTSACFYCGTSNVPTVWVNSQWVMAAHDDEKHENRPCPGSGKP